MSPETIKPAGNQRRIDLASLGWDNSAEGVRSKAVLRDRCQIRIVEFAPGSSDAEQCGRGHIGYVLAGRLEVTFADGTETFVAGDALMIRAGDLHWTRVVEGPVRLFLVEQEPG